MGCSATTYLFYGVEVGSQEEGYPEAFDRIMEDAGYNEDDYDFGEWLEHFAEDYSGVEVSLHGSYDEFGKWFLSAKTHTAYQWTAENIPDLEVPEEAKQNLLRCIKDLGLDDEPTWKLCCIYG